MQVVTRTLLGHNALPPGLSPPYLRRTSKCMCAVSPSSGVQHLYDVAKRATAKCKGVDLPAEVCEEIADALGRGAPGSLLLMRQEHLRLTNYFLADTGAVPLEELGSDIQAQQVGPPLPAHLFQKSSPPPAHFCCSLRCAERPEAWMVVWVPAEVQRPAIDKVTRLPFDAFSPGSSWRMPLRSIQCAQWQGRDDLPPHPRERCVLAGHLLPATGHWHPPP